MSHNVLESIGWTRGQTTVDPQFRILFDLMGRKEALQSYFPIARQRGFTGCPKNHKVYLDKLNQLDELIGLLTSSRLVNSSLICHPFDCKELQARYRAHTKAFPSQKDLLAFVFGGFYSQPEPRKMRSDLQAVCDDLSQSGREAARQMALFRMTVELDWCHDNGWFIVMDTLTARADLVDTVFRANSGHFSKYIKRIRRDVAREGYGHEDNAPADTEEYFRYCRVMEHGARTGRSHIHVLLFCKFKPSHWVDPTLGSKHHQEISAMKCYWDAGFSTPKPFRTSHGMDAWSRAGWHYPVVLRGGRYVRAKGGGVTQAANYLAKYISKDVRKADERAGGNRCSFSRGFGFNLITEALMKAPERVVQVLSSLRNPLSQWELRKRMVPVRLLRRCATLAMIRGWRSKRQSERSDAKNTLRSRNENKAMLLSASRLKRQKNFIARYREIEKRWLKESVMCPDSPNTGSIVTEVLKELVEFEWAKPILREADDWVRAFFYRDEVVPLASPVRQF